MVLAIDDQALGVWGSAGQGLKWHSSGPNVAKSSAWLMAVHALPTFLDCPCQNTHQMMQLVAMAAQVREYITCCLASRQGSNCFCLLADWAFAKVFVQRETDMRVAFSVLQRQQLPSRGMALASTVGCQQNEAVVVSCATWQHAVN